MGIKAPSCMAGLASAASTFGQSVKKTGVAAYNKLDRFAAKHPLVAAASGIAVALLGSVVAVLGLPLAPLSVGVAAVVGGTLFGLGLKHSDAAFLALEDRILDLHDRILYRLTAPNEKTTKAQPKYSLFQGQKQPNHEDCVFSVNKEF